MSLQNSEIVENFYSSDFYKDEKILTNFLHPDVELSWYGSTGLKKLDLRGIAEITRELSGSYDSLRAAIEKTVAQDNQVAIHFTYHVKTIENPDEELPLARFMAIWELKDNKMFRGVQISQLGEDVEENPWE